MAGTALASQRTKPGRPSHTTCASRAENQCANSRPYRLAASLRQRSIAIALGRGGALTPLIAAWMANALFMSFGLYLMFKVRY